jgi:hypothetical protein
MNRGYIRDVQKRLSLSGVPYPRPKPGDSLAAYLRKIGVRHVDSDRYGALALRNDGIGVDGEHRIMGRLAEGYYGGT